MDENDKLSDVVGNLHKLTATIFSDAIQRKLILDNLTEAVFTVDKDLKITLLNKAAEKITGIAEQEALGKECNEIFNSPLEEGFCIISLVLQQKRPLTNLTRYLQAGDNLLPVMTSASPLTDNSGDIVGGVQSFQEIQEFFQRQLVVDSAFDSVLAVDLDYNITLFNKAAVKLTGFSREEVLGRPFSEVFFKPDQRYEIQTNPLIKAVQQNRPVVQESVYINDAGKDILPVSVRAAPLIDSRGLLVGGVMSFRDNTDRIQSSLILDHIVDGVFTTDRHGRINSFNRAAMEISGYIPEDVLGIPWHELFSSGRSGDKHTDSFPYPETSSRLEQLLYLRARDNRIVPVSVSSVPMLDARDNLLGTVSTFHDITRQLQHRYILDSVTDGVFTVDQNLIITTFNKALEKISGYTAEEALGKKCKEIFGEELCSSEYWPAAEAIPNSNTASVHNTSLHARDGSDIPVNIIATALSDDRGRVIGGVQTVRDLSEITELRRKLAREKTTPGVQTRSPRMQKILSFLPEFARSDSQILVLGESGTGKELIAQSIHAMSNRNKNPFIALNCSALPTTLLESELFGYRAGAFTDARKDKEGRFAAAESGTLFLDEIGDIAPAMQVKLLRVIQTKTYEPLGSNTPVRSDVRLIAATNRDLEKMVQEGSFREDLYYRLNVVKIELPPLRERMEDLPLLIEHFIDKFNKQRNCHVEGFSEKVLSILKNYDYPGNIRELENIIEHVFIFCQEGLILPQHLPEWLRGEQGEEEESGFASLTLKELEKKAIIDALRRNNNRRMKTCRDLGISKDTLRRKIASYDINDQDVRE